MGENKKREKNKNGKDNDDDRKTQLPTSPETRVSRSHPTHTSLEGLFKRVAVIDTEPRVCGACEAAVILVEPNVEELICLTLLEIHLGICFFVCYSQRERVVKCIL